MTFFIFMVICLLIFSYWVILNEYEYSQLISIVHGGEELDIPSMQMKK